MNNNPQLPVNHEIALINGIATRISSAVPRKEETEASPCMVIIPGNPGDIGFYDIFISALFRAGNEKLPVYGVSHAGHAQVDEPSGPCSWTKQRDRDQPSSFTLDDQIEHKLAFLAYYILPKTRVILIGHSVGAYIALEVLKRYHDRSKILKCILLFPTIERVDSSPSGRFWTFVSHYLHWPCLVATFLVSLLPSFAQRWTINWWMYLNSVENKQCITNATQSMLTYSTVRNMLEIGRQLVTIRELDQECIEKNLDKLVFFYGLGDPWVPRCHYEDMKRRFPEGDVKLATDEHIQHAFVLDASEKVAQMVWQWIDENIV